MEAEKDVQMGCSESQRPMALPVVFGISSRPGRTFPSRESPLPTPRAVLSYRRSDRSRKLLYESPTIAERGYHLPVVPRCRQS